MIKNIHSLLALDIKRFLKNFDEIILILSFYLLYVLIISFTSKSEIELNSIIWPAIIFAGFLSIKNIFSDDYKNGILEVYLAQGIKPLEIVTAKLLSHILLYLCPLILISLIFAYSAGEFNLELIIPLIISAPLYSALFIFAASISISDRNLYMVSFLCIFPLMLPIIIFSSGGNLIALSSMHLITLPLTITLSSLAIKN